MKKVLIIARKLSIGGAEKVARDIGYYADKSEFDIHYLVFGDDINTYEQELTENGCTVIHMDPPNRNHLKYYINLKNLIEKEKYDVIHSHTMFSSGWAMFAGYKCGVPVRISHSHTIKGPEKRGFIKNSYESFMRKVINKYSTHCIGCGLSAGYWLFGKEKFDKDGIVILNGIDLNSYKYDENRRNDIRKLYGIEDSFLIGHVGHFADVKNQKYLVEMMPELIEKQDKTVLLLLGDGETRDDIIELTQSMNLENRVIFTGNVSNVGDYLSAMDVFAFPSKYEGMPLSLIEAQANGLPCIISNKIPKDVYLTDLIAPLSIGEENKEEWINSVVKSKRDNCEKYYGIIGETGFSTDVMLKRIYAIYEGGK